MGYYLTLFYSTAIVYQITLLLFYFKPFLLDWSSKRKQSWNPYYDRFFTVIFLSLFVTSILFLIGIIYSNNKSGNSYLIYFYTFMIMSTTIIFTVVFFNKEKLKKIKTTEDNETELEEKREILKKNRAKLITRLEKQTKIEKITQNLEDLKKLHLEEIVILNTGQKSKLDVQILTKDLKEIIEANSEKIIEKFETKNKSINVDDKTCVSKHTEVEGEEIIILANESVEKNTRTFNHNFHKVQLIYLFNEFKRNEFINADFDKNDFCQKFLNGEIKLTKKITSVNLWHVHHNLIENIKLDSELELITFVEFFISFKNEKFKYGGVKNGSQSNYSKSIQTIQTIFKNIPK